MWGAGGCALLLSYRCSPPLSPMCSRPPKFPPTTSGQHLLDKYAATHAGYAGPGELLQGEVI